MKCEVCGSSNLIKENGDFVCKGCGMKYTLEEARKLTQLPPPTNEVDKNPVRSAPESPKAAVPVQVNKPVDSKLAKAAGICAFAAMILSVLRLLIDYINLSFLNSTFECIFTFLAAKTIRDIYKGKAGSDSLKKVPAALLGWDIYAVIYPTVRGISDFTIDMLVPVIFDVILLLTLIFISKELPEKKLKKSKIITIIGAAFAFIMQQLIRTISYDPSRVFWGQKSMSKAQFFSNQMKRPFQPFSAYKNGYNSKSSVIDGITSLFNIYAFLITFLILLGLALMVFAAHKGELRSSNASDRTGNKAIVQAYLIAGVILIPVLLFAGWLLAPIGANGGSGRGPGSTCKFDGCNKPAVGPTYEFCSKHKKALNEYWNYESRN